MEQVGNGPAAGRPLIRHWWMLIVLASFTVVSLVDRNALSLLVDDIKSDLSVTDSDVGLLLGPSFALLYALAGLPAGYLMDRFNRRYLVIAAVMFWSSMTAFSGVAATFGLLFAGRMGVGLGEAMLSPAVGSLIRNVFAPQYRARAFAIILLASSSGGGIALLLVGALSGLVPDGGMAVPIFGELAAWRVVLLMIGLVGIPLSLLALSFPEPKRLAEDGGVQSGTLAFYRRTLVERRGFYIPMFSAQAVVGMGTYGFAAWMPTALSRSWGTTPATIGVTFGTVQIAGAITGLLIGPALMDALVKRHGVHMTLIAGTVFILMAMTSCFLTPLMPTLTLSWIMVFLHWISVPSSGVAAYTAIAAVTPSSTMAKMIATSFLCLSVAGYGLGPTLVAYAGEHLFEGPLAIGRGVSLVTGTALALSAIGYWQASRYLRARGAAIVAG